MDRRISRGALLFVTLVLGALAGTRDVGPNTRIDTRTVSKLNRLVATSIGGQGGIVCQGTIHEFVSDSTSSVCTPAEVELRVDREDLLFDGKADYGVFKLSVDFRTYSLDVSDEVLSRLVEFVARDGELLFSIPQIDDHGLSELALVPVRSPLPDTAAVTDHERRLFGNAWVAPEFAAAPILALELLRADVDSRVERLDRSISLPIVKGIREGVQELSEFSTAALRAGRGVESWTNADFHTIFRLYLPRSSKESVDFSGLPIRYYWQAAKPGRPGAYLTRIREARSPNALAGEARSRQNFYVSLYHFCALLRYLKAEHYNGFTKVHSAVARRRGEVAKTRSGTRR